MNGEKWPSDFITCPSRLCKNPKMGRSVVRELGNGLREYRCHTCKKLFFFNVKLWQMHRWHSKFSTLKYLPFAKELDEPDRYTVSRLEIQGRKLGIIPVFNPSESDLILVLGGDGTMLKAVHSFALYNKPFIGVSFGHLGFLLNAASEFTFEKIRDEDYAVFSAPLLEACITKEDGRVIYELALNDVIIREDAGQSALLEVMINNVLLDAGMFGDGIVISTPLGSTAYTTNLGSVPLIPTLPILEVTPVAPKPRSRIPLVVPESTVITVKALQLPKRKVRVNQGSIFCHRDVAEAEIRLAKERVELIFFKAPEISWDDFFLERFREKVYNA